MFEVITQSPMDSNWKKRDKEIIKAAGRHSDYSGAGFGERDHGWEVKTFEEAQSLKASLEKVQGVTVTIREDTTHG